MVTFCFPGQVGFLRFLSFLADCDFKSTPIVLNFHEKLSLEQVSAIELDFVKRRSQLPPLFIVTPEDKSVSVWTKHLAPVLLYRIQILAKQALSVLKVALLEHCDQQEQIEAKKNRKFVQQIKKVFRADTNEFDVLIYMKKLMNPRSCDGIDASSVPHFYEHSSSKKEAFLPIVDFDPVQIYLSELRNSFGHLALFLHDSFGGNFIAVVWKPEAFKEQDFSVITYLTTSLL
jgi:U3 small nucleolar RNA-associated protein 22